jgi:hypothetical protein
MASPETRQVAEFGDYRVLSTPGREVDRVLRNRYLEGAYPFFDEHELVVLGVSLAKGEFLRDKQTRTAREVISLTYMDQGCEIRIGQLMVSTVVSGNFGGLPGRLERGVKSRLRPDKRWRELGQMDVSPHAEHHWAGFDGLTIPDLLAYTALRPTVTRPEQPVSVYPWTAKGGLEPHGDTLLLARTREWGMVARGKAEPVEKLASLSAPRITIMQHHITTRPGETAEDVRIHIRNLAESSAARQVLGAIEATEF